MPRIVRSRRRRPAPVSATLRALGERIREARIAASLSQSELGAPYFTRAHVSAVELGKIRPAMPALEHFARKLGKPVSYFLADTESERAGHERELEIAAIGGLLTLTGAAEGLRRAERSLDAGGFSVRDTCRLHLAAGSALNLLHRAPEAIDALATAERLARELHDESLTRAAEYQLAVATRIAGNSRTAREQLERLLERVDAARPPDATLRLRVLITLGACAQDLGDPAAATTYYRRALEWSNEIGDLVRLVSIHQGLGNASRALGDQDAAAGHYTRALASAELAQDLVATLVMHNALAVLAADAGRLGAAAQHVARAIELARFAGPAAYLAQCHVTQAEVALKAGDAAAAQQAAEAALALVTSRGAEADRAKAGATLVLAELDLRGGRVAGAERRLRDAAAIYRALDARAELGDVLMRLSRAARTRHDLRAAERYAVQAYTASRPVSANVGA